MNKPLNPRQESFCAFIAAGSSAGRAYEKAGYMSQGNVADSAAERLLRNVEIKKRVAELRKPVTKKLLLTKDRKREILRDIAEDTDRPAMVRIRAIEVDSKLAGHYEADRLEVDNGPRTLDAVRERAKSMASAMSRVRLACEAG
jgi:phage terminase small subunit